MSTIERITANREKIIEALKAAERKSYLYPCCEYRVYIDSDNECGDEEWLAHDNAWFEFRRGYFRTYIHTFCHQYEDERTEDEIDEIISSNAAEGVYDAIVDEVIESKKEDDTDA